MRTLAIESMKKIFECVDILVTPTTAQTAPRLLFSFLLTLFSFHFLFYFFFSYVNGVYSFYRINTLDGKEDMDVSVVALLMRYAFLANFTGMNQKKVLGCWLV